MAALSGCDDDSDTHVIFCTCFSSNDTNTQGGTVIIVDDGGHAATGCPCPHAVHAAAVAQGESDGAQAGLAAGSERGWEQGYERGREAGEANAIEVRAAGSRLKMSLPFRSCDRQAAAGALPAAVEGAPGAGDPNFAAAFAAAYVEAFVGAYVESCEEAYLAGYSRGRGEAAAGEYEGR
jgi:hypothetical protein